MRYDHVYLYVYIRFSINFNAFLFITLSHQGREQECHTLGGEEIAGKGFDNKLQCMIEASEMIRIVDEGFY